MRRLLHTFQVDTPIDDFDSLSRNCCVDIGITRGWKGECVYADACQHKLQSLGKYITDVEAFVNIHMDAVRNRMIKFEILLMVGTFALGVYAVIAGVLGENIPLAPHSLVDDEDGFLFINLSVSIMCIAIFVSIIVCARRNGLM